MASLNALQMMRLTPKNDAEAYFDSLMIPHWTHYLSPMDVEALRSIATSKRLSGNMQEKLNRIKYIMNNRGFVKFAGGTNRVVYKYLEDPRFLAKIAIDNVGMADNPAEYNNQWILRPYCTRMFYVTDCGTVGFAERVLPITSKEEFKTAADDIFDIIYCKIIGKYIIEDIGTEYFMNFGIRAGQGPVLLDYPYIYELDGSTIICQNQLADGTICGGEIDYDAGFNNIICTKCGRKYLAREMKKDSKNNFKIIKKGGNIPMNVSIVKGGNVLTQSNSCDFIKKPNIRSAELDESIKNSTLNAKIMKNGEELTSDNQNTSKMTAPPTLTMDEIMAQVKRNTVKEMENMEVAKLEVKEDGTHILKNNKDGIVAVFNREGIINNYQEVEPNFKESNDEKIEMKEEGTDIVTEIPDVQLDEQPSVIPMSMRAPIYKDEQPIDESMIKAAQQRSNKAYQDNKGRQVIGNVNRDLESEY